MKSNDICEFSFNPFIDLEKNCKMPEKIATDSHTIFEKPEELTVLQSLGLFIYNPKKGAFFTRTPLSWAKIFIFYCIFYSTLACLFSGMLYLLLNSIDARAPRWQLEESRIGSNPAYQEALGPQYEVCDYERDPKNRSVTSCTLDVAEWEPCTARSGYGYNAASPCVFVKLNKIYSWQPEFYNASQLPDDMPLDLQNYIRNISENEPAKLRTIWLSCAGETEADREHLGPLQYIPERGFPGYFYPYLNTKGYLSPLVAVHFQRLKAGVIVSVECRAWAQNIDFSRRDMLGSVTFQIFVE
ncbi:hypothetical protein B566_EDAN012840 [Ephemera danica]|nr:hypothetical protein B566_EDAN012840 [Ephemera danica]